MGQLTTVALLTGLACSILVHHAAAFSEDLCVETPDSEERPHPDILSSDRGTRSSPVDGETRVLENCLTAEFCDPGQGGDTSLCRANLMLDAAYATQEAGKGNARSMVHVDAVHFIAQAVGLEPQAAYWLAAYNETTDVEQYLPFGMNGEPLERDDHGTPVTTPFFNGWARFSAVTGGISYHFVAPYNDQPEPLPQRCDGSAVDGTICGMYPDLDDADHEGTLVHLRAWAFDDRLPCADGLTNPDPTGNYYLGVTCFLDDPLLRLAPSLVDPHIDGEVPTLTALDGAPIPYWAYSGRQIARYDISPKTALIREIRYADQLELLLVTYYGKELPAILGDHTLAQQVALVRMGIYLHTLEDRISHYDCGDHSYVTGPDSEDIFHYTYDSTLCTQDLHAYNHYLEIGHDDLPERDATALAYTFDELEAFAQVFPEWQVDQPPTIDDGYRAQVITDVLEVLRIHDACERLEQMILLVDRYGFQQMPGNTASATPYMCPM